MLWEIFNNSSKYHQNQFQSIQIYTIRHEEFKNDPKKSPKANKLSKQTLSFAETVAFYYILGISISLAFHLACSFWLPLREVRIVSSVFTPYARTQPQIWRSRRTLVRRRMMVPGSCLWVVVVFKRRTFFIIKNTYWLFQNFLCPDFI